jgi:hypothetical protein
MASIAAFDLKKKNQAAPTLSAFLARDGWDWQRNSLPDDDNTGDTSVHPDVIKIALGATVFFLLVAWGAFAGDGETALVLGVITVFSLLYFGLFVVGSVSSVEVVPDGLKRSFVQFLRGKVSIATGTISGWDALIQIAGLPVILAGAAVAISTCWSLTS